MRIQRGALPIAPGQHLPPGDDRVPITTRRCHEWIHGTLDHDLLRVLIAHLDDVRPHIESDGHPDGQQVARRPPTNTPPSAATVLRRIDEPRAKMLPSTAIVC